MPDAIDASGRTDVTDLLNALLARVPPGSVVAFPRDGRYRIEGTLVLANARDVTIEGNGASFVATTDGAGVVPGRGQRAHWPRLRQQWRIRGGSGITLRNLTIQGANPNGGATPAAYVPALEGQAGVAIQRASGVRLESVHVTDTYGDGVWVAGGSTDVTIRDSTFERLGRQGVAIVNGERIVVEASRLRDISRSVFDLEPVGRSRAQDVRLRDNEVGDYGNFLLAAGGSGPGVNDVWLERNRVAGGHGVSVAAGFAGVEQRRRTGLHIIANRGTGEQRPASGTGRAGLIQLENLDQVEIRDNRQAVASGPAISLDRVCDVAVAGNDFSGARPEQQVVTPCRAAAPVPSSRVPSSVVPSTTTPATPTSDSGDSTDIAALLAASLVGFAAGLAVAAVAFVAWTRGGRRRNRED